MRKWIYLVPLKSVLGRSILHYYLDQWKYFSKTLSQWGYDYGLFTSLPRIIADRDFSPSSFKLKSGILPLLRKYVS